MELVLLSTFKVFRSHGASKQKTQSQAVLSLWIYTVRAGCGCYVRPQHCPTLSYLYSLSVQVWPLLFWLRMWSWLQAEQTSSSWMCPSLRQTKLINQFRLVVWKVLFEKSKLVIYSHSTYEGFGFFSFKPLWKNCHLIGRSYVCTDLQKCSNPNFLVLYWSEYIRFYLCLFNYVYLFPIRKSWL